MGHWEPVHTEVHAQDLEVVEGELPADLAGAFVRTGPNPKLTPEGGYHLFDGDGMIHAVRIGGGKAAYCNRWVQTARLAQEEKAGWPVAVKSECPALRRPGSRRARPPPCLLAAAAKPTGACLSPCCGAVGDYRGLVSLAYMLASKLARVLGVLSSKVRLWLGLPLTAGSAGSPPPRS